MGFIISRIYPVHKEYVVLVLGLANAQKGFVVEELRRVFEREEKKIRIARGDSVSTGSFDFYKMSFGNKTLNVFDIADDEQNVPFWSCYYVNVSSLIYVINFAEREKLGENLLQLKKISDSREFPAKKMPAILVVIHSVQSQCDPLFMEFKENVALILGDTIFKLNVVAEEPCHKGPADLMTIVQETGSAKSARYAQEREAADGGFYWMVKSLDGVSC